MSEFNVGDIVYRNFSPQQFGKILEVTKVEKSYETTEQNLRIRWGRKGNPVEIMSSFRVKLLADLIMETETKLERHRENLRRARLISGDLT